MMPCVTLHSSEPEELFSDQTKQERQIMPLMRQFWLIYSFVFSSHQSVTSTLAGPKIGCNEAREVSEEARQPYEKEGKKSLVLPLPLASLVAFLTYQQITSHFFLDSLSTAFQHVYLLSDSQTDLSSFSAWLGFGWHIK